MSKASLRAALNAGQFVAAPGIHDMITATIVNKLGFDFVYASGYWMTASAFGLPDAGIATYTQMLDRVSTLARTVDASVIADADTGYGGLLNVHHTVRGYEEAGVVAIQIEDQEFPKKCGHTPYKRVVPMIDMVEKIKVACEARRNPAETLIIARTDARQTDGFEGALKRGIAYGEAGADVVFVEALESEEEMRQACKRISKPMMANMADGGKTPIRSRTELSEMGYHLAIYPSMTGLAAAAAVENALKIFKAEGTSNSPDIPLFNFREFSGLIGFEASVGIRTPLGARGHLIALDPVSPAPRVFAVEMLNDRSEFSFIESLHETSMLNSISFPIWSKSATARVALRAAVMIVPGGRHIGVFDRLIAEMLAPWGGAAPTDRSAYPDEWMERFGRANVNLSLIIGIGR